jgi:hypothetical protein
MRRFRRDILNARLMGRLRICGKGLTHLQRCLLFRTPSCGLFADRRQIAWRKYAKETAYSPQSRASSRPSEGLLTAFKAGDPEAVRDFTDHHLDHLTDAVGLASAQLVVARKSGFSSWPKLVHYVEQLRALEGMWLFTSLEVDGSELPAPAFRSSRLLLNGDRFRMESKEATYPADPTVSHVIGSRLGHEVVAHLVEPLLGGIHAGRADQLSLAAVAPHLWGTAQCYCSAFVESQRREASV